MNQNTIRFVDLDIEGELNKQKEVGYIEVKQPESHDESEQPDNSGSDEPPAPGRLSIIIEEMKRMAFYFLLFMVLFMFWEIVIRFQISGTLQKSNLSFVFFVPAEAMFFAALTGFTKNKIINIVNTIVFQILIAVYYIMQVVYLKNFGSLFSVSMVGMGTQALGNFWWALTDAIKACTKVICFIVLPIVMSIATAIVAMKLKKEICKGYHIILHGICVVLVVLLWFGGIGVLKLCGTDRQSGYYAFHNSMADTDTTSARIGAFTTTLLEGGSYYFGIKSSSGTEALAGADKDALNMTFNNPPAQVASVSNNQTVSENIVEEPYYEVNPVVFDEIDFAELESKAPDYETMMLCEYFADKDPSYTNKYTGMFEGYNLIYICGEGFSSLALDEDVTPTLYMMAHNGIVLNNYYNSFLNTTTNGEYAFMTSLWPDVSRDASCGTAVGSFAQSCEKYMPMGMADLMTPEGINCYAYHNFYGHYYRRSYSWPNLGYENMKFLGDGMNFTSTWPASDLEMMEQSIDDYIENAPFQAYYMTFSGHGPYTSANYMYNKNLAETKELLGDRAETMDSQAIGYLAGNLELEKAMVYLLDRLEETGQLDKTVIVLTGDHTPYYLSPAGKESILGHPADENFEIYHSTCIMYNAGMEEPIETDTYCCNVDILPTILNLFGIEYESRLLMGRDIFSDGIHRARLYNGSFINDKVMYNSKTGEVTWLADTSDLSEEETDAYLNAMIDYTEGEYAASVKLLASNYYFFVWKNSGMLTDEEIAAETTREFLATNRAAEELLAEQEAAALAAALEAQAAEGATEDGGQAQPEPQPEY